jgi:ABC-2 type transport system ATP-binding protein
LISVRDLYKEFDGVKALRGVCLDIGKGETFGLIGPNGAGKTTMIKILTGQIPPTAGEVLYDGEPVDPMEERYRLAVGLVPQEASFYGRLTARENLTLLGRLYGMSPGEARERGEELLSWIDLMGPGDRQVRFFSRGMQQRLSLAMGLINEPDIR